MSNGALFQLADNGQLKSLRKTNGKTLWTKKLGRLAASSPALDSKRVYVTLLVGGALRPRADRRAAPAQRQAALVADAALAQRVLAAGARRADLLRVGERDAVLPQRAHRQGQVDLPGGGRDQGQPDARAREAVLRRLRRARAGREGVQRPPRVVEQRRRALLRDGGGRRRARVHRLDRRPRVRVLDQQRQAALVAPDRPLRLRLGGGQPRARGGGGPCSSAPTTGASTRSTRAAGGCAGPTCRAGRSPAPPR